MLHTLGLFSPARRPPSASCNLTTGIKLALARCGQGLMMGDSLGDYRIERSVATGGTGRILRARHARTQELVAIKVPVDPSKAGCLVQESRLLSRLVAASTHIVSWRCHDLNGSAPWYAMQWVDGAPLSQLLARGPNGGHPLGARRRERTLHLLARVAAGLAALHERGICHGDLTPNNILVRADGAPVLIDFGSAFEDSSLLHVREAVRDARLAYGTPGYVSPHATRGRPADWRADLYALGCVCWHALTGAPPTPASAGEAERLVFEPRLRQLLLRLLEPTASEAVESAREVEEALRPFKASSFESGVVRRRPLHRTPLLGRQAELSGLRQRLAEARAGRGSALLVRGEAGLGKSRLLNEAVAVAQRLGFEVMVASCADAGAERAHATTTPLVELLLGSATPASAPRAAEAPSLVRARRLEALFDALQRAAARSPLLLVLDDLHWADELTWAFVKSERFARLTELPVCVWASYRSGAVEGSTTDGLDPRVWSTLELPRLGVEEVRAMALAFLGDAALPSGVEQRRLEVTAGNPLHVTECALELRARREPDGSVSDDAFSELNRGERAESLSVVMKLRLGKLSLAARKAARLAAMFGDEVSDAPLASAAEAVWPGFAWPAALEELRAANVVEHNGVGRYRFTHNLLARCSLEPIEGLDERALGRDLARYCEARGDEVEGGFLAMLYALAGARDKAFACFVESARKARADNRLALARAQLARALEVLEGGSAQVPASHAAEASAVHAELADLLQREARDGEADAHYERALTLAPRELEGVRRASLLRKRARGLRTRDRYPAALSLLERARAALGTDESVAGFWQERIEGDLAELWLTYYARKPFGELLKALEPVVLERGDRLQQCDFYQCACASLLAASRYRGCEASSRYAERALGALLDSEHRDRVPDAHMVAGFSLLWRGPQEWEKAAQLIQEAERGALWMDDLPLLAQTRTYLALAHRRRGLVDEAQAVAEAAHGAAERIGSAGYRGAALATLSWAHWRRGELDACLAAARKARVAWRDGALRHPFQAFLNLVWADALRLQESFDEARALLAELLAPDLQVLPEGLEAAIRQVTTEPPPADARAVDKSLQSVSRAALRAGFL